MNPRLRTIFLGYGTATLVQGAVGFAAVPLLILTLGQQAFAYWAMLEPLVAVLAGMALIGVHYGHLYGITSKTLLPSAALRQSIAFGSLPAAVIASIGGLVACWLVGIGREVTMVLLCIAYVLAESCILMFQFHARALSDAMTFASTVWLRSLAILAGLLIFKSTGLQLSLVHYFVFMIAIDALVIGVNLYRYRSKLRAANTLQKPEISEYWGAVKYGLPIMIAAALAMLVGNGDRYVVHSLMDTDQLPAYVVMAKLAGAMSFAMAPVNLWWPVARNKYAQSADRGQHFFSSAIQVLLAYYLLAAACLWLAAEHLLHWYAPGVTGFDPLAFLLLLCAGVALSISTPINIGMLTPGKTPWLIVTVGISAISGIGLAVLLVPRWGYLGAACATLGAQILNLLFTNWASQRIQRLDVKPLRLAVLCVVASVLFAALFFLHNYLPLQLLTLGLVVLVFGYLLRAEVAALLASNT